jgi:hypothetical protein
LDDRIGGQRTWFQRYASAPHYDVCEAKRALAGRGRRDRVDPDRCRRRLVGDLFRLGNLGRQAVKGFAEPVEAFAVEGGTRLVTQLDMMASPVFVRDRKVLELAQAEFHIRAPILAVFS